MQRQIQSSLSSQPSKLNIPARLAQTLQRTVPAATKTYTIYGQTEALFKSCAAQADYTIPQDQRMNILTGKGPVKEASQEGAELGHPLPENKQAWWFTTLNLPPTFSTWSQITFLHLYVIVTQLRAVLESESEFQNYHRYLIEHFSREAEDKMVLLHNLNAQGIRSRYLKDLLLQWRGILVSYDEGLVKGDAVLASAIWRNLFRADEDVDWVKVAQVVAFLRLAVRKVGSMTMDDLLRHLNSQAGTSIWPAAQGSIATLVDKQSRGINAPFEE
jgi:cytochrome b pre-mRNA-processing protein 3